MMERDSVQIFTKPFSEQGAFLLRRMREYLARGKRYFGALVKWLLLAGLTGAVAGGAGTLLYFCIAGATDLRLRNGWLVWLLPAGGALIAFLYHLGKADHPQGTNLIIEAIRSPEPVPIKMAPLIFVSTVVTHLVGGSAGREGASLQLGGSLGYGIGRLFRLDERDLHLITMCGMSACFGALFGTPVTAAVFVMEVVTVGVMQYSSLVPCTVAALVGVSIARQFREPAMAFAVAGIPAVDFLSVVRVIALAALCAGVSWFYCKMMRDCRRFFQCRVPDKIVCAAVGGAAIALLTLPFGRDYLGVGSAQIAAALGGRAQTWAFLLKILFTALTLGCGFKGGEIIPALFVGSTFGCVAGGLLGLDPSFGASLGFVAVFCGVTNCPLTSLVLSAEVFGAKGILFYLLAAAVSYLLSGYSGIYSRQKILYAKDKPLFLGAVAPAGAAGQSAHTENVSPGKISED